MNTTEDSKPGAEDALRYKSYRRSGQKDKSKPGYTFAVLDRLGCSGAEFDWDNETHRRAWVAVYGTRILDFGSGHGDKAAVMAAHAINVTPFDPYPTKKDDRVDPPEARRQARRLIEAIGRGERWSAIFVVFILNAVVLLEDRKQILTLLAALSSPDTPVYFYTLYQKSSLVSRLKLRLYQSSRRILSGDPVPAPAGALRTQRYGPAVEDKVFKYHTLDELRGLLSAYFEEVSVSVVEGWLAAICRIPRRLDKSALENAIRFEFNLPYEDGSRLDLAAPAIEAFQKRGLL